MAHRERHRGRSHSPRRLTDSTRNSRSNSRRRDDNNDDNDQQQERRHRSRSPRRSRQPDDNDSAELRVADIVLDPTFVSHGKTFVRYKDALIKPSDCIALGLRRVDAQARRADFVMSDQEQRLWRGWQGLIDFIPGFELTVARASKNYLKIIKASGRSDNINSLLGVVFEWLEREGLVTVDPNDPNSARPARSLKTSLGYINNNTARLLCPCNLNLLEPGVRTSLEGNRVQKTAFPLLFFENYSFGIDTEKLCGALQARLGVWAYQHLMTGPSSVENNLVRGGRKSNSELAGFSHVTYESIAYVLTLLRFTLSSRKSFSWKDKEFKYGVCYDQIITTLKKECERERDEDDLNAGLRVMQWWNTQVFGDGTDEEDVDDPNHMLSLLSTVRADQEATRRALPGPDPTANAS
ncbi:hypothetical protein EXIGLDRAFT_771564 [Exidia glandulosa HHB12029]|uniref:Uncharacterized protein n=1 Tax=Exidia glandulosa HHB12029 TaxID=1314781 RepID=A0A165FX12_EXIGL|nr:hypothetical protein EXIGLDRAFT_771564 [Exidia glandulosa HHB12029]